MLWTFIYYGYNYVLPNTCICQEKEDCRKKERRGEECRQKMRRMDDRNEISGKYIGNACLYAAGKDIAAKRKGGQRWPQMHWASRIAS